MKLVRSIILRILGFIAFLIMLVILGALASVTEFTLLESFVGFFIDNIALIVVMTLLFLLADIFRSFILPLNLPYPLFSAFGAVTLVRFLLAIFIYLNDLLGLGISWLFTLIALFVYPIVFLTVLTAGYIHIFRTSFLADEPKTKRKEDISWEDIGSEFRNMIYDIIQNIRNRINQR